MKTLSTAIVLVALLVVPAGAAAKPDAADKRAAIAQCKSERGKTKATRKAFKAKYHSFSRCVRQNTTEEAAETRAALRNAAKECKAERSDTSFPASHDGKSFQEFYGTNKNGKNAYGKCVSQHAKQNRQEHEAEQDQEDQNELNAARQCRAERKEDPDAFRDKYGTNRNKRNAFGKCVSKKAHEEEQGS
jgi:hypothetical protein